MFRGCSRVVPGCSRDVPGGSGGVPGRSGVFRVLQTPLRKEIKPAKHSAFESTIKDSHDAPSISQ